MKGIKLGYKETPIGVLPKDWEVKSLGSLITYKKGFAFKSENYCNSGVRVIRISDLADNSIREENKVFVSLDKREEYDEWQIKDQDIIITTVGSRPPLYSSMVGKVIFFKYKKEECLLNQNCVILRSNSNILQRYLYLNFNNRRYISHIKNVVRGNANQVSITLEDLFKYNIPIPPKEEQEKIAQILMTWDEAIEKQEKLIGQEKEFKKGMMQKIFSQKLRFKDENGNDYPEWEEKQLGEIGNIITGSTPETSKMEYYGGEYLFISPIDINSSRYIKTTKTTLTKAGFLRGRKIPKMSICFVCIGSTIGKIAQNFEDCITNQQINSIVPFENISADFIYSLLEYNSNKIKILAAEQAVPLINKTDFSKIKINIPSLPEQEKIADFLSTIDEKIEVLEKKLEELKEQKKGLMQKLLTGEVRV